MILSSSETLQHLRMKILSIGRKLKQLTKLVVMVPLVTDIIGATKKPKRIFSEPTLLQYLQKC
jgi:hypothetical protein